MNAQEAEKQRNKLIVADYATWKIYRNEAELVGNATDIDGIILYQRDNQDRPAPEIGADPRYAITGDLPVQSFAPKEPNLKGDEEINFTKDGKPDLVGWKFVKYLGSGVEGMIGVWEQESDSENKLVIKETKLQRGDADAGKEELSDLTNEYDMLRLQRNDPSATIRSEGSLDRRFEKIGRLYLENWEMGDLAKLIRFRKKRNKRFNEATLWKFLEYFVKMVTVLQTGKETYETGIDGTKYIDFLQVPRDGREGPWRPIIHFDIKPENILLGGRDPEHPDTPICKLADFGHAMHWPPDDYDSSVRDRMRETEFRRKGTDGRLAPEQFSDAWDYQDWDTSGIAGLYGYKTDIWGIGGLMYSLITLNYNSGPSPGFRLKPNVDINGEDAKGQLYGYDILQYNLSGPKYSEELIDVVLECLYEKPGDRIDLISLHDRVKQGYENFLNMAERYGRSAFENWDDFLIPTAPLTADEGVEESDSDENSSGLEGKSADSNHDDPSDKGEESILPDRTLQNDSPQRRDSTKRKRGSSSPQEEKKKISRSGA